MLRRGAAAKPTLNLGGIQIVDHSDDEQTSDSKKTGRGGGFSGENPFDSSQVVSSNTKQPKSSESQEEKLRNLFFHQRSQISSDENSTSTGEFGAK
jgi:hypothetical protein